MNNIGQLKAVVDNPQSGHVSVSAVDEIAMEEWIKSRATADTRPHELTKLLQSISMLMTKLDKLKSPSTIRDEIVAILQMPTSELTLLTALDHTFLERLVLPTNDKALWELAAFALQKIGYPNLKAIAPQLTEWLQDMNWPGARTIFQVLSEFPDKNQLSIIIENAIAKANSANDRDWIENLTKLAIHAGLTTVDFKDATLFSLGQLYLEEG